MICLPSADTPGIVRSNFRIGKGLSCFLTGTVITNFVGPLEFAQEVSSIFTNRILHHHPLAGDTLQDIWVLAFALLRAMAEQLDFAFRIFDPADFLSKVGRSLHLEF